MEDLFAKLNGGQIIAVVAVTGGVLCGVIGILHGVLGGDAPRSGRMRLSSQDMLDRGMSPEDIRTVLEAGTGHSKDGTQKRHSCCT